VQTDRSAPLLTQQIVPCVDDITTSAYGNVVAEVEVEQSSSCHVRDACTEEQSTLIIANVTTFQSDSYRCVNLLHTCHSQYEQPPIQQPVGQLRFPHYRITSVEKIV
jgi:hypothetical protein